VNELDQWPNGWGQVRSLRLSLPSRNVQDHPKQRLSTPLFSHSFWVGKREFPGSFLDFASDHEWLLGKSVDDRVASQAMLLMSAPGNGLSGVDARRAKTIYLAAVVGTRYNPAIKIVYQWLCGVCKAKKVVRIA